MGEHKKTVAIDFDGVLHTYDKGWQDGEIYGELVPGAGEILGKLSEQGYRLVVFTTRSDQDSVEEALRRWGVLPYFDEITNIKPIAVAYVDDRAVPFRGDWGVVLKDINELTEEKK